MSNSSNPSNTSTHTSTPGISHGGGQQVLVETPEVPALRKFYYCVYSPTGPIPSKKPILPDYPSLASSIAPLISPPHTAGAIQQYLCQLESIRDVWFASLFVGISGSSALEQNVVIDIASGSGPGRNPDEALILVVRENGEIPPNMKRVQVKKGLSVIHPPDKPDTTTFTLSGTVFFSYGPGDIFSSTLYESKDGYGKAWNTSHETGLVIPAHFDVLPD